MGLGTFATSDTFVSIPVAATFTVETFFTHIALADVEIIIEVSIQIIIQIMANISEADMERRKNL